MEEESELTENVAGSKAYLVIFYSLMILRFLPNIRTAKPTDTTGYTWGKPYAFSNIMKSVFNKEVLHIAIDDIVAERWIVSDDKTMGSKVIMKHGPVSFSEILGKHGEELLGSKHFNHFGPHLGIVMKLIDTHPDKNKGSLSVQVHPAQNHPTIPSKPEVWLGKGSFYLGFKDNLSDAEILSAVYDGTLEQHLNLIICDTKQKLCVRGGLTHAIRHNSFLYEWSNSPTIGEIAKGGLADATIGLYDKTDGKVPRPGKEKPELALEVIKHANLNDGDEEEQVNTILYSDNNCSHVRLFDFEGLVVERITLSGEYKLATSHGTAFYVESGVVRLDDEVFGEGEEGFIGYHTKAVKFIPQSEVVIVYLYHRQN